MKFHHLPVYTFLLTIMASGFAHAAVLVTSDDSYGIPSNKVLEADAGVLENDTLDGENALDGEVTVTLVSGAGPGKGDLTCPDVGPGICSNGSFIYTPNASFDGEDTFQYQALAPTGETSTATVTLSACSGGPTIYTCWHEAAYLDKLAENTNYNLFIESFEGSVWNDVRSPDLGTAVTAPSILSKGITWTTNFPLTNEISTVSGAARTGSWGGFDPLHGLAAAEAAGDTSNCDVNNPTPDCLPHDGLSGSGTKLHGVGGYFSGSSGANIAIMIDGVEQGTGLLTDSSFHFIGVIDTSVTGFTNFKFRELDGKIGQEFWIFGDDFSIATTNAVSANNPPVLSLFDDLVVPPVSVVSPLTVNEGALLRLLLTATDPDDGDSWSFSVSGAPAGSSLDDNFDGTAIFSWRPDFTQAGDYPLTFTVTDNGIPVASASESITITVLDVNRPPVLNPIGAQSVSENTQLSILLTASDPDANNLSFAADSVPSGLLPSGASFVDNNNGTATFSWTPVFGQAGDYPLNFTVSDDGVPQKNDFEAVTITVTSIITDATAPVVTAPANITVAATDANGTAASVAAIAAFLGNASATDNVDTTLTITNNAPVVLPLGATTVTFSATDNAGNTGTAQATVTVSDQTPPVITLSGAATISIEQGSSYTDEGATAFDNVDGDISGSITPTGTVNTAVPGIYTITYNVSDVALNAATPVIRTVTVGADATPPVVTAPANITVAATDANGTAASVAAIAAFLGNASATDNVDTTLTITNNAPVVLPLGATTVTFSATDNAGNTGTAQATVTVSDQTPPVISLTGAATISIEQGSSYTDEGATAFDNVDGDISGSITLTGTVNTAVPGIYTITYNVSDVALNAATPVIRTVTVGADATAPVVTAPANITVAATDANGTAASVAAIAAFLNGASATDNVDTTLTITNNATVVLPLGATTVTFSSTDTAGNTGTAQATVTVSDQTPPVISLTGAATISIEQGSTYADEGATAFDNVDGDISGSITPTGTVNTAVPGIYTITYNVSDVALNAATPVIRTVTVGADATAPLVTAPANITVAATDANGTAASVAAIAAFLGNASATDNVDTTLTITNNAPVVLPLGATTVTFSATDNAGNTGTAQATVTVSDQTRPVITLLGASSMTINVGDVFSDPGATAIDNVDGDISPIIQVDGIVDTGTVGLYTLTYNVSDAAGNVAIQVSRSVSVQDGSAPVVTAPANIIVAATDASGTAASVAAIASFLSSATAIDTVDGVINTISHDAPLVFPLATTIVTFSATDSANNTGQAQATVTVTDQTKPVITLTGAATISIEQGSTYNDAGVTASDNVDGNITANIVISNTVNTAVPGSYTVTYNVSDVALNAATAVVRTVTVTGDVTRPVITLLGTNPVSIELGTAYVDAGATATDNIDGDISTSITPTSTVNVNAVGTYSVTYNVSDAAGNAAAPVVRIVNVTTDVTKPVIALLGSNPVSIELGTAYVDAGATATDNIDGNISGNITPTSTVNVNAVGTYSVTYNVSDAAGNAATPVVRTVNVTVDVTVPVITLLGSTPISVELGTTYIEAGATATDNIDGDISTSITPTSKVNVNAVGTYSVTYNVSDAAGNAAAPVVRTVNVTADATKPVITLLGANPVSVELGTAYVDAGATATDNIDGPLAVTTSNPVNINLVGTYTVTYDVTDAAGNAAVQITRTVNVTTDVTKPVITLLGSNPVSIELGTAYVDAGATATDNIDGNISGSITLTSTVNTNAIGSYTVTYNVSDTAGNTATPVVRTVEVVVTDTKPPVITPPPYNIIDAKGLLTNVDKNPVATAIDDVDGPVLVIPNRKGPFAPGRNEIIWTAMDSSGNTATAIQIVDVNPLVEFEPDRLAVPGATAKIRVLLNGNAPAYPVNVAYEIQVVGAAVTTGNIVIQSGTEGVIDYPVPVNTLPGDITFTLGTVTNAVKGPKDSYILTIVTENVAPVTTLEITQSGVLTRTITADGGLVSIKVMVNDTNTIDNHIYDWSITDNVLLANGPGLLDAEFDIDPSGLTAGIYRVGVTVTDDGSPNLGAAIELLLAVLDTAPVLTNNDSDGDGINDVTEGIGDSDSDGIPDYLDGINNPAAMQGKGGVSNKWLLNAQSGLKIRLGNVALLSNRHTAHVTKQEINQNSGKPGGVLPADTVDTLTNAGGYFDFEIYGLSYPGQSVLIVIPQHSVIPGPAAYRKYTITSGWKDFVEDSRNSLSSAPGEAGICPPPGDQAFIPGLNPNHYCVQLMIEDGGPNDANDKNGVITDPGGIAVAIVPDPVATVPDPVAIDPGTSSEPTDNNASAGGGGGGSIDLITLILLISLYRLNLRSKRYG